MIKSEKITIGIPAYNEEKDIANVIEEILNQDDSFLIEKILIYIDCCTDKTVEIVKKLSRKHQKIAFTVHKKRQGKLVLINQILAASKTRLVLIANADNLPSKNAIHELKSKMISGVGVVGPRGVCVIGKRPCLTEKITCMLWEWHHLIALKKPKILSFMLIDKNIIKSIITTCPVDEPAIEADVLRKGKKIVYAPKAKLFLKPPTKLKDYILQRRRIHFGYFLLRKHYPEYRPETMKIKNLINLFLKDLVKKPLVTICAVLIEIWSKFLGYIDFIRGKKGTGIWEMAMSSKGIKKC